MAIHFTEAQQKVLDARNHNILVSAAAGSGKTAVLVERIVRLITEGENPPDIDRLLVVTFTRAAAAQMRERIGDALSKRLRDDPGNTHLQRQAVLLHNAQITTIDSFCTFLLRNYFSEIDLDPGFRQIEPAENDLIAANVLEDFLEEKYAEKDPAFLRCVEYFCSDSDDRALVNLIKELWKKSGSHPSPEAWLRARAFDYDVKNEEELFSTAWMQSLIRRSADFLMESDSNYAAMQEICLEPGGPEVIWTFLQEEREGLFAGIRALMQELPTSPGEGNADTAGLRHLWMEILRAVNRPFKRYTTPRGKKYAHYDEKLKESVKKMRSAEKNAIGKLKESIGGQTPEIILAMMESACEPVRTISSLTLEYIDRLQAAKKEKHIIDFVDLEHLALDILAERKEDGTYVPRRVAKALRGHFAEILIDEYQDSNEVQELLLQIISGEDDGRNNRFMVGDIKQSIYRFRLARPEIFMEKYDSYSPGDPKTERIDLDQNFRSRGEVLDSVNAVFMRIMRREIGGVDYNENVSLKKGAVFPNEMTIKRAEEEEAFSCAADSPYCTELLLLDTADAGDSDGNASETIGENLPADELSASASGAKSAAARTSGPASSARGEAEDRSDNISSEDIPEEDFIEGEDSSAVFAGEISSMTDKQKEALLIAGRIRQIVGVLPVRDEDTGEMRPARYGDIVILLRSTVGWIEDLRAVFEREGIPAYAESRTGYFAAEEIRVLLNILRVLDNPRQDIPLYSALRGYFGNFTQDEISMIRLASGEGMLFDALCTAAGQTAACPGGESVSPVPPALAAKCADFLSFLEKWRDRILFCPVTEIVNSLLEETGYMDYCTALPGGAQRSANLHLLQNHADSFTKTEFTGLFQFLRYIDGVRKQEIDYGEANILDEKADVVRIMTIHKSKGLEFPVCIVAGLSGGFSFRHSDASGQMIFDGDWGVGVRYYDATSRVSASTARKEEIAEKIRRDSMGEELRVLYVAMTRAKEKLILTASKNGLRKKIDGWRAGMTGFYSRPGAFRLSPFMIGKASCFAELICEAVMAQAGPESSDYIFSYYESETETPFKDHDPASQGGQSLEIDMPTQGGQSLESAMPSQGSQSPGTQETAGEDTNRGSNSSRESTLKNTFPMEIRMCSVSDLTMQAAAEQLDLSRCDEILRGLEGHPLAEQPDPEAAQELAARYFRVYPHEELRDLYAQTSVSELKHRAMQAAYSQMEEGTVEGVAEIFPDPVPIPYIPSFIRKESEVNTEDYTEAKTEDYTEAKIEDNTEDNTEANTEENPETNTVDTAENTVSYPAGSGSLPKADFIPQTNSPVSGLPGREQGPSAGDAGSGSLLKAEFIPQTNSPVSGLLGREQGLSAGDAAAGARRGTAFHRALELLDYSQRKELLKKGAEGISEWIRQLSDSGIMSPEDAELVSIRQVQRFLRSRLADRMEAADSAGLLFREQPFVLGCSADRVEEHLPKEETVMVQGIIDAFFVEEGKIYLVDYKTDRVSGAKELKMRYSTQLALYAEALENAYEVPVAGKIIYSTSLGKEILL